MSLGEKLLDALNELNALGLLEEFKAENRELVDSFMNKFYVAELATLRKQLANERAKLAIAMEALTFYADDANHESREYIVEASRPEDERYDPCEEEHYDSTPYFEDGGESATTAIRRINELEKQP